MDTRIRVAIIDDEVHAIDSFVFDLEENHSDDVEIVFSSINPVDGLKKLRAEKPDLLFLDINMPGLSGLDLVQLIEDLPVRVVFTTAHLEFAMKAVETIACGYLLKPIHPDDLKRIIDKVVADKQSTGLMRSASGKIPVPDIDGIELIPWEDIIYCKSDSNYCEINLIGDRKMVASKTLKYFEMNLPADQFYRVHKSYLVNFQHIKKYLKREGGELFMSNGQVVPVSRTCRDEVLRRIQ